MNLTVVLVGLPCWLVKGSHQGLIRETKLIPSQACSHLVEEVSLLLRPLFQTSSKHHNVIALHREEQQDLCENENEKTQLVIPDIPSSDCDTSFKCQHPPL